MQEQELKRQAQREERTGEEESKIINPNTDKKITKVYFH